ncbi:MAG: tetratricopeptide repeat protein [Acidobacteriia bacterium]|nr:tetratricopeptide repeat protein [Terriglobia bacterium]
MSRLAPRGRRGGVLLAVGIAAVLPYLLLPGQTFVFDAPMAVVENRAVQSGSLHDLLTSDFFGAPADAPYSNLSYRPLVSLTYALEVRAVGNAPWAFHAVDMLLHAAASVSVLLLLEALGIGGGLGIAGAFLFAVHPVASETVASVVGRADLMACLGLLLALLLHHDAGHRRRPWVAEALALLALGAALLSKEYSVSFPFLLVAFDEIVRAGGARDRRDATRRWGFWAGAFLLLGAYVATRLAVLGSLGAPPGFSPSDNPLAGAPWWIRWSTAFSILAHAARLLVVPLGLSHHYAGGSLPVVTSLLDPRAMLPAIGLAVAAALALVGLLRRKWLAPPLALLLFLFPLLPSLNTVGITGVLFAERWLYLPAAGLAVLAAWALARVPVRPPWPRAAWAASACVLVLLAGLTALRVRDWGSPVRLAESALEGYPRTAKVWHELGIGREEGGRIAEAADAFRRSLDLDPSNPRAWKSYAAVLGRLGRHRDATLAWRRLITLAPKDLAVLWVGLGDSELAAGDLAEAVRALEKARSIAPADPGVRSHLAEALLGSGNAAEAVRALISDPVDREAKSVLSAPLLQALLRLARAGTTDPAASSESLTLARRAAASGLPDAECLFACGLVASQAAKEDEARHWFRQALSADPAILRRRHEAAVRLEGEGRYGEAAGMYHEILAADPGHAPTLFNFGRVLLLASRPREAVPALVRGLAIQDDARARELLAEARRRAGGAK